MRADFGCVRLVFGACLALSATIASAQGGPPLVTDDPGTPGDGHWEINLATAGGRTSRGWDVDLFDADINYGIGDSLQLNLDVPYSAVKEAGQSAVTGPGAVNAGVKWRFVDGGDTGFSLSTYPHYLSAWSASSKRRGVASPNVEFFLPVEFARKLGGYDVVAEVGYDFIERAPDAWKAGVVLGHECAAAIECLVELHETRVAGCDATLLNFGLHWTLTPHAALIASAGRDVVAASPSRQQLVFYLGFQLQR